MHVNSEIESKNCNNKDNLENARKIKKDNCSRDNENEKEKDTGKEKDN